MPKNPVNDKTRLIETIIKNYESRRAYHYKRLFVADTRDRGCLNVETRIQRLADLEDDHEYISLAKAYWSFYGKDYNVYDDALWINADFHITYTQETNKNCYYLPEKRRTPSF